MQKEGRLSHKYPHHSRNHALHIPTIFHVRQWRTIPVVHSLTTVDAKTNATKIRVCCVHISEKVVFSAVIMCILITLSKRLYKCICSKDD